MTTTTTATAAGPILAIDLGKYKSVACIYRSAEDQRFQSVTTSRDELTRLLDKHRPAVVLIEAGRLAGWAHGLGTEAGVKCLVANTSSDAWKFKHRQRKTDKDDALRLAEVYRLGKFPTVTIPAQVVREKRAVIEARQQLVGRRVALQNRIRAVCVGQGMAAPLVHLWVQLPIPEARLPLFLASMVALLFAGAVYDRVSRGRFHPVSLWGAVVLFAWGNLRALVIGPSDAWHQFAAWLIR